MKPVFKRPKSLKDTHFHYCPGCGHGIIHRLICEVVDEMRLRERVIGMAPVGCAVLAYNYFDFDVCECPHGRAPAVATGIKRVHPDAVVFSYQGDGDLASIGMCEIVHAAARGERISVFFVNNAVYGMTGGQMAPTTLLGQRTDTTPHGRSERDGFPIRVCELLNALSGVAYLERVAVDNPKNIKKAKQAIKNAFEAQIQDKGFSLVEFLSQCPVVWRKSPVEATKWLREAMIPYYPLQVFKTF